MSKVRSFNNAASSSTGIFPSTATFPTGVDLYQVVGSVTANFSHGSTKTISWKMQGSLAGVHWADLAVATTSTGTGLVNSTAAGSFNRARIVVTANATTGNVTTTWAVAGRP